MAKKPFTIRKFYGREIAREVAEAVQTIPAGSEIVTLKAGEGMPITCAYLPEDADADVIPAYAWDGETWTEIGYL